MNKTLKALTVCAILMVLITVAFDHVLNPTTTTSAQLWQLKEEVLFGPDLPEDPAAAFSLMDTTCREADVAFLFTNEGTDYIGLNNVNKWANERVAEVNKSLNNSDICHRVRLVAVESNIGISKGIWNDLGDLGYNRWTEWGPNGQRRNETGADYVMLIGSQSTVLGGLSEYCGLGFVPTSFNLGFIAHARAAVAADCGGLVIAHELGHNFGGMHDINTDPTCVNGSLVQNSCGGLLPSLGAITIMSYFQTGYGTWIEHYSNPNVTYNGVPTGRDYQENNAGAIRQGLGYFYAMKNRTISMDVWLDNSSFVVLPKGSPVTLSGTVLIPYSKVNTSLGEAETIGTKWYLDTVLDPTITDLEIQINNGQWQTFDLDLQITSVTVSGTVTGANGLPVNVTPDLGFAGVSTSAGSYAVQVVPGTRTLNAFVYDTEADQICTGYLTVAANTDLTGQDIAMECREGFQTFMPLAFR